MHRLEKSANYGEEAEWLEKIEGAKEAFIEEMDDDFNTANGISVMFELAKEANRYLREEQTSERVLQAFIERLVILLLLVKTVYRCITLPL